MSGMQQKPLVNFVIVSYNCEDVIEECVRTVLQFGSGSVVVVDNASNDNTRNILLQFERRITLILNEKNLGYTVACNQGIKAQKAAYIFLLNPDAYLQDNSWMALLNTMESDSSIGAIAPVLHYPNGMIQNYIRRFPTIAALWVEFFVSPSRWRNFSAYRRYTCEDLDLNKEQIIEQPAGAALLFRSGFLMDERFFIYGSDLELCQRIINSGFKIQLQPASKVFHHQSKGGTGSTNYNLKAWLQLDALYGYGLYFKEQRGYFYYLAFKLIFGIGLGLVACCHLLTRTSMKGIKWKRFTGFLKNQNFRHFIT